MIHIRIDDAELNNYIQYECSWWDGRSHNCKWLDQSEVSRTKITLLTKIGFTQ